MSGQAVQGFCPMGCGETLMLGEGGYITCGLRGQRGCPNPTAITAILGNPETDHIVVLTAERFSIQHPLRERVNGELFDCGLHRYLTNLSGPPAKPGRYRVPGPPWRFAEVPA